MEMTPDEIVVNYRQAKNKGQQIKILADLNLCKIEDIIQILVDYGGYERQRISRAIGAARKCSSPVILPKMEFLTKSGIKVREESVVKEHMEFAPEPEKIPYKKPEIIPEPPKQEPVENPEPVKESEKLPIFVKQALIAGYVSLVNGIDTRKERIKELEAEIAELEKDFDALKKWEDEHK